MAGEEVGPGVQVRGVARRYCGQSEQKHAVEPPVSGVVQHTLAQKLLLRLSLTLTARQSQNKSTVNAHFSQVLCSEKSP